MSSMRSPAWKHALSRPLARFAAGFFAILALLAVYAPFIASGHPLWMRDLVTGAASWPLFAHLNALDLMLALTTTGAIIWLALPGRTGKIAKLGSSVVMVLAVLAMTSICSAVSSYAVQRGAPVWLREMEAVPFVVSAIASLLVLSAALVLVWRKWPVAWRGALVGLSVVSAFVCTWTWTAPPETFPYESMRRAGEVELLYTLVPYSPAQRPTDRDESLLPMMSRMIVANGDATTHAYPAHILGTDEDGRDVLSQLIHACRVALTVGFVATGVALTVGVFLGALMGYLGGAVDAVLMRVVEVFLSLPVLFVLIVAAGIFPRSVLVMAVLIGLFSWQSVARLTRAEFLKLRDTDFVHAARAQGVGTRSIIFTHLLPNALASSIVDASFTVSAAILAEAVISYLGFGPVDRASWGRLLSQAVSDTGGLVPHLAILPGLMIFLTVLSANALGSAANEALDPSAGGAR